MSGGLFALPLAAADWTAITLFFFIFGGAGVISEIMKNFNKTRVEMAQLRAQAQGSESLGREVKALRDEVQAVRQQLDELRDTSMQYDLSFDTALQRIERRVERIEQEENQSLRVGS